MKKLFGLLFFFISIFIWWVFASPANNILISEVQYDAVFHENRSEWFELFNPTPFPVNLSWWTVEEQQIAPNPRKYTFQSGAIILPWEYFLVTNSWSDFNQDYPGVIPDVEMMSWVWCIWWSSVWCLQLNNTTNSTNVDHIILRNPWWTIIDQVVWWTYAFTSPTNNNRSICRIAVENSSAPWERAWNCVTTPWTWTLEYTILISFSGNTNSSGMPPSLITGTYYSLSPISGAVVIPWSATLQKTGYTFNSWNSMINWSWTVFLSWQTTIFSWNITLYAQRILNTYLVTFVDRDSTVLSTGMVDHGSGAIAPANPTRTGYTFSGWNSDFSTITWVTIVTGEYTINQYTISFDTDGGTTIASITDDYGTGIIAPVNPIKTGYTFSGWVPTIPVTMPAMDVTVTGQWNINSYTLSYTWWWADGWSAPMSQTGDYNTSLLLAANTFTRTGYTFSGWDCGSAWSGYLITMNTECTAQWELNEYLVTFEDWDTTVLTTWLVNHGSGAIAPTNPTRTGYTFSGWNMDFMNITGTKTITAEYMINQYALSYVAWTWGVVVWSGMQSVPYLWTWTSVTVQAQTWYRFIWWSDGKNQPTRIDWWVTWNRMVTAQFILIPSSWLPSSITPQTTNTTPPWITPTPSEENWEDQIDDEIIDSPILTQEDKQRIFNPSFTQSCFDYKDEKTIDQWVEVSETFVDAHQLFFSYSLTKRQWTRDYRPFSTITREEAARFFVEFAKNVLCRKPNYTYTAQFSDIGDADTTLASFIEASYEFGIFHGDWWKNLSSEQSRTFRPKALMTQEELAAVIVRLVTNEYDETAGDDRSNAYKIFLKNYAKTQLNSSKRETIAEVVYDVYRWNEYTLEDIGYVIKK